MSDFLRTLAIGATAAAVVSACLAIPAFLPAAIASDEPTKTLLSTQHTLFPKAFDPRGLAKYDVAIDDSVSTEVTRSNVVRKIGYGHSAYVTIAQTSSGTYSSDGLTSPHVRYPGIEVTAERSSEYRHTDENSFGANGWVPVYHGSVVIYASRF